MVEALREMGFEAYSVAQEHSAVADLWNHQLPDYLVFLDVSLDEVRKRRDNPRWPGWIYDLQTARLAPARDRANLVVDTSGADLSTVIQRVSTVVSEVASR